MIISTYIYRNFEIILGWWCCEIAFLLSFSQLDDKSRFQVAFKNSFEYPREFIIEIYLKTIFVLPRGALRCRLNNVQKSLLDKYFLHFLISARISEIIFLVINLITHLIK